MAEIADVVPRNSGSYEQYNGISRGARRRLSRICDYLEVGMASAGIGMMGGVVGGLHAGGHATDDKLAVTYALTGVVLFSLGAGSRITTALLRGVNVVREEGYRGITDLLRRV